MRSSTDLSSLVRLVRPVAVFVFILAFQEAQAGSATWLQNPASGNWNAANNWMQATVPNGTADMATFQTSNIAAVSISANTTVDRILFSADATTGYTITASPAFTLTINGAGISNNSGLSQNFVAAVDGTGNRGIIQFRNNSTAGLGIFTNTRATLSAANGGLTIFYDTASGGNGVFVNEGAVFEQTPAGAPGSGRTRFSNSSTAGHGTFITKGGEVRFAFGGYTQFLDNSSAGSGTFTTNGGTAFQAFGGQTQFYGTPSAGDGTFITNGGKADDATGGLIEFADNSTAGNATFTTNGGEVTGARGGLMEFRHNSSGGNGTFLTNGAAIDGARPGAILFFYTSTAGNAKLFAYGGAGGGEGGSIFFSENSTGGTAQVQVFGNGNLDLSGHAGLGVTIGSIGGDGYVRLGARTLTVGNISLDMTFSGALEDGGSHGGTGGSLTKIGNGSLTVSGASTYTGQTTIEAGKLVVDGSILSAATVNNGGTLGGSGTTGSVTVNSGGIVAPGQSQTLHVNGNYTQNAGGVLKIRVAGADPNASGRLDITGSATVAGTLEVHFLNGFLPASGQIIKVLNVGGAFAGSFGQIIFPDLRAGFQFQAEFVNGSYQITALSDGVPATEFLNISTRMNVGTGDNALIGGFIVTGNTSKKVIIRAIGPSLASLPGRLADPTLELRDNAGGLISSNDNWVDSPQAQQIIGSGLPPSHDDEAAIVATLAPGSYTAVMRGAGNTTGLGVVEAYDLAQEVSARLANISSRGLVETGDNVMIGGFIAGYQAMQVIVRAIGPSLTQFGIANALADPTLELHNSSGTIIAFNNDWQDTDQVAIAATGIPPAHNKESAILATLAPGNYTAIVRGLNDTTGVGLVEVYHLQ
jgi:autotransporter-associated beta strand protein